MTSTTSLFRETAGGEAVTAGTQIFAAGDSAEHLFVVQEGRVDIARGDQVLESVGPGGMFGEMAMIDGSTRSADAVASEDSKILPIDKKRFEFLITETPFFARAVLTVLVERLRSANANSSAST
jgi:CRP-like cAMP-binding protein